LGTFYASAEGFKIFVFNLKFKKYKVRRVIHSLVLVITSIVKVRDFLTIKLKSLTIGGILEGTFSLP
jgi:hypothetical protein